MACTVAWSAARRSSARSPKRSTSGGTGRRAHARSVQGSRDPPRWFATPDRSASAPTQRLVQGGDGRTEPLGEADGRCPIPVGRFSDRVRRGRTTDGDGEVRIVGAQGPGDVDCGPAVGSRGCPDDRCDRADPAGGRDPVRDRQVRPQVQRREPGPSRRDGERQSARARASLPAAARPALPHPPRRCPRPGTPQTDGDGPRGSRRARRRHRSGPTPRPHRAQREPASGSGRRRSRRCPRRASRRAPARSRPHPGVPPRRRTARCGRGRNRSPASTPIGARPVGPGPRGRRRRRCWATSPRQPAVASSAGASGPPRRRADSRMPSEPARRPCIAAPTRGAAGR